MVWCLQVRFEELSADERREMAASLRANGQKVAGKASRFRASSIEVLQSSNASGAKVWSVEEITNDDEKGTDREEKDEFIRDMPELSADDLIVDADKFETIDEQRTFFARIFLDMTRDDEGWEYFADTNTVNPGPGGQLQICSKDVEWSPVQQLRSTAETELSPRMIFDFDRKHFRENMLMKKADGTSAAVRKAAAKRSSLFGDVRDTLYSEIVLRTVDCPWPMSPRYSVSEAGAKRKRTNPNRKHTRN